MQLSTDVPAAAAGALNVCKQNMARDSGESVQAARKWRREMLHAIRASSKLQPGDQQRGCPACEVHNLRIAATPLINLGKPCTTCKPVLHP